MTSYTITYKIRRQETTSIHMGDWQEKQNTVIAGDDAIEAICAVMRNIHHHDFLLKEVKINGLVDIIV